MNLKKIRKFFSIAPDRQMAVLQVWQHIIKTLDLKMQKYLVAEWVPGKMQDFLF